MSETYSLFFPGTFLMWHNADYHWKHGGGAEAPSCGWLVLLQHVRLNEGALSSCFTCESIKNILQHLSTTEQHCTVCWGFCLCVTGKLDVIGLCESVVLKYTVYGGSVWLLKFCRMGCPAFIKYVHSWQRSGWTGGTGAWSFEEKQMKLALTAVFCCSPPFVWQFYPFNYECNFFYDWHKQLTSCLFSTYGYYDVMLWCRKRGIFFFPNIFTELFCKVCVL